MSNIPISVQMTVAESDMAYNMTVQDQIVVNPAPAPTNMITNGDFSAAGATTDGWSPFSPSHSTIAVTDGKLVLTHTVTNNRNYGVKYAINTQNGHCYLVKFKLKKTESDDNVNAKVVVVSLGNNNTNGIRIGTYQNLTQNSIIESACAIEANSDYTELRIGFQAGVSTAASNNSMLELYYVEMYDITDIVSGLEG